MTVDFADYFWGEKNNGFDVLYHNMKHGVVASKELADFLRERSAIEENNYKLLSKVAKQASNSSSTQGTFAPVWAALRGAAEKLASLHLQMAQRVSELIKDVSKYADELHKRHKAVKEEESSTLEVVQNIQSITVTLQKAKDMCLQKGLELEKLKKDNASQRELEKSEAKFKKSQDDYKSLVDKYTIVRNDFETKMTQACRRFQDVEETHLKHMKEFLNTYADVLQTNHEQVGQVHIDFKRQCLDMTVDKLLEQFVQSKYTGFERPGPTLEPPLPRRKKCPELAYRHHEFINATDGLGIDAVDTNVVADKVREVTTSAVLPPSQLSKAISRISTEYRLQFAWPRRAQLTNGDAVAPLPAAGGAGGTAGGPPRKSLSMGALKQGVGPCGPAPVHMKKRPGDVDHKRDGVQASELEPLVGNNVDNIDGVVHETEERDDDLNELKITFRSVTKEEKEKENTRKVAPTMNTMPPAGRPSSVQARPIYGILQDDIKADNEKAIAHARKEFLIRHHLDRTTGIGDGALLPSPTREKLEPVVPRRRDDSKEIRDEIQPRPKSSPKNSPRTGRSQSLGPLSRSPKRQTPRTPSVNKDAKEKEKEHKDKEARDRSSEPERHPRPMTAEPQMNGGDTTGGDSSVASTPLSHSATVSAPAATAVISNYPWFDDEPVVKSPPEPTRVKSPEQMIMRSPEPVNWTVPLDTGKTFTVTQNVREGEPLTRPHSEAKTWAATSSIHSTPQSAPPELAALHKSHHHSQQSGYKSPESESISLGSYTGLNGHKDLDSERDSPLPTNVQQGITPTKSDKDSIAEEVKETMVESSKDTSIKPITGTNLRCLDDPTFEYDKGQKDNSTVPTTTTTVTVTAPIGTTAQTTGYRVLEAEDPVIPPLSGSTTSTGGSGYHVLEAPALSPGSAQRSVASDVLEKARNRFDKFWGKGSSDNQA
ncbi:hypothetical protein PV327_008433 [Microctonus hyperodae]|uniref:F-BAR domain-containing protein n=1 Tax=Microctonus hyperodae TaxID=165561 RepID=A0AA39KH84_MICHY|nr:hypothetical protein PV327_008433 [Microctonus hyperodae]